MKKITLITAVCFGLALDILADSVKDWRKDIQIGDILYNPNGFVYDPDGEMELPVVESIKTGHIGIYVGDLEYGGVVWPQQVIEATFLGGVYFIGIETWDYPNTPEAWIMRPKVSEELKGKAVDFVIGQLGKPYTRLNFLKANSSPNNNRWYCSELVWAAYLQEGKGVNLADFGLSNDFLGVLNAPVSPADIFADNDIVAISWHGEGEAQADSRRVRNISLGKTYNELKEALADVDLGEGQVIELEPGGYLGSVTVDVAGITIRARSYDESGQRAITTIRSVKDFKKSMTEDRLAVAVTKLINLDDKPIVISVEAPRVTIKGLAITGTFGYEDGNIPRPGIYLNPNASYCRIEDCIIFNNPSGIGIEESNYHEIWRNRFLYNTYGIGLYRSYGGEIHHNDFENNFKKALVGAEDGSDCAAKTLVRDRGALGEAALRQWRAARDQKLPAELIDLYYRAAPTLSAVLADEPELSARVWRLWREVSPGFQDWLDDRETGFLITPILSVEAEIILSEIRDVLDLSRAGGENLALINELIQAAQTAAGKTFGQAAADWLAARPRRVSKTMKAETVPPYYFYLNSLRNNGEGSTAPAKMLCWYSREPMSYILSGQLITGYLGNYWEEARHADENGDGVADMSYGADLYPLAWPALTYQLVTDQTLVGDWVMY